MRQQILNLFTTPRDMSWEDILLNIVLAAVLGFFIFLSYAISHRGTIYSRKFNASLVILAVLTGTVMTVIGNNIALSLGMVGALSIVRFRTAIKDSRDTVYIFWSIIVGICCGVGDYAVACIGSAVTFVVILLLGCIKSDNRMLLIIRAHRSKQEPIKAQVYKLFRAKATLRVENTTEDTVELIYEITQKLLRRAEQTTPDIPGSICSATSFLRNWDSILEKKRANLRSISEPARLRQPPPPRSTGAAHARGRAQSIREERRIAAPPVLFALLWVRLLPALYGPFCGPLRPFGGCPWGVTPPARECLPPAPPDTRRRG